MGIPTSKLIINMQIDFYTTVIDNYGDMGFSFNLAKNLLKKIPNLKIRYFADNKNLFEKLSGNTKIENLDYYDLSEINTFTPSNIIFNFFDRKLDTEFLNKFDIDIKVFVFGYFLMHKGVESLHNTNFQIKNLDITHIIPSLLPNTGGIIINYFLEEKKHNLLKNGIINAKKTLLPNLEENLYSKNWVGIFCYKETFEEIKEYIINDENNVYLIFDNKLDSNNKNIINIPFLEIDDYYLIQSICDKNIVRGENTMSQAILSKKPFLWDIYKENNNAHTYKIDDFCEFLNDYDSKEYEEIFKDFNILNTKDAFKKFINFEDKIFFENIGNYVLKNCDLVEDMIKRLK